MTLPNGVNSAKPTDIDGATKKGIGSDTKIEWNPENTKGGRDVNGSDTRPVEIGLAHELVHSEDAANGTMNVEFSYKIDPDTGTGLYNFEVNTYEKENIIRKEQGIPLRQEPKTP